MWEYFCQERDRVKRFPEQVKEKGKQEHKVSVSWNRRSRCLRLSPHPRGHLHVRLSSPLILPFDFPLHLPHLFLLLHYMKSVVNLHNSCNETVEASDDLLLSTGYEPKAHDFYETAVEPAAALLRQSLFCGPRLR